MTYLELRDWLNNLNETALAEPVHILIGEQLFELNNWRIILLTEEPVRNYTPAEIVWPKPSFK